MISTFPYYGGRCYQLKEIMGIDKGKYPPRNIIEITGKGKKVAMKMREILQLLGK